MTYRILFFSLLLCVVSCGQNNIAPEIPNNIAKGKIVVNDFKVNGVARAYTLHIPESYTGKEAVPLLFVFHALGGTMQQSYETAKFYDLAEEENFILVHPDGIDSRWNAVRLDNNADITFVESLMSTLQQNYTIDSTKIYAAGMSNGGFLSIMLACQLADKIAAVASVAGAMFQNTLNSCQPSRAVPLMHIHGTADRVVKYNKATEALNFWISHNQTDTVPDISLLPDSDSTDNSTVERHVYKNGNNNSEIQHLKVQGGGHAWPGAQGNRDIDASEEIWNFLQRFAMTGG